jgi:hypothetical protein
VVQTTWTLGANGDVFSGYEMLHVLGPNDLYSD